MGARRAHDENVVSGDGDHDHVEYATLRRWARSSLAYPSHLDTTVHMVRSYRMIRLIDQARVHVEGVWWGTGRRESGDTSTES